MRVAPICLAPFLAPLMLAACIVVPLPSPGPTPVPPTPVGDDACGASGLQGLVGQPASVLQTMRFGVTVRVIEANMAVTMDYSANRLNIWLNPARIIQRVTCG